MKFEISTTKFQELLNKASKCTAHDSMARDRRITTHVGVELKDGVLSLTTTDGTNCLFVSEPNVVGEDFYFMTEIDRFLKLVSKITSDTVVVELSDKYAIIRGNGTYKLEVTVEGGEIAKYPVSSDPLSGLNKIGEVSLADIKTILAGVKPSLEVKDDSIPFYKHYYVGDIVIGTDMVKASTYKKKLLDDTPRLVNVNMMNLLGMMTEETIEAYADATSLGFKGDNCMIYGVMPSGLGDFNVAGVESLLSQEYPIGCKLNRSELVGALDRIKLFVNPFDDGVITLHFTDKELTIVQILPALSKSITYLIIFIHRFQIL